jgi:hypothetical protein
MNSVGPRWNFRKFIGSVNEVLPDWAEQRVAISAHEFKEPEPNAVGHGQKK